jgi:secretion/DNA translocation related TadE-like protein
VTRDRERGSGSVLAVGVLGAVVLLTMIVLPLCAVLVVGQSVRGAADAAALAAADTLSGLVAGVPCQAAAEIAALNGASVVSCTAAGPIASVTVTRQVLGWTLNARARAGPPGMATAGNAPDGERR